MRSAGPVRSPRRPGAGERLRGWGGPLWAKAPVEGTSTSSRTVAVNARRVGRTPRPPALISSMIVLPTFAGYEAGAQPRTEPGRQRERRDPQRRPGRTDT